VRSSIRQVVKLVCFWRALAMVTVNYLAVVQSD